MLREADRSRYPIPEVAKKHGGNERSIATWRKRYSVLDAASTQRLRQLGLRATVHTGTPLGNGRLPRGN